MKRFWISWWQNKHLGPYTLHSPWWISGERGDEEEPNGIERSVCAAIIAEGVVGAHEQIYAAYDKKPDRAKIEWRFCEPRPNNWNPFSERFPRAEWMQWPEPAEIVTRGNISLSTIPTDEEMARKYLDDIAAFGDHATIDHTRQILKAIWTRLAVPSYAEYADLELGETVERYLNRVKS